MIESTALLVAEYTTEFGTGLVLATELMLMTLPPSGPERLQRLLDRQDRTQHVGVELAMELGLGDGFDRLEFVHAGVVHQDVG